MVENVVPVYSYYLSTPNVVYGVCRWSDIEILDVTPTVALAHSCAGSVETVDYCTISPTSSNYDDYIYT